MYSGRGSRVHKFQTWWLLCLNKSTQKLSLPSYKFRRYTTPFLYTLKIVISFLPSKFFILIVIVRFIFSCSDHVLERNFFYLIFEWENASETKNSKIFVQMWRLWFIDSLIFLERHQFGFRVDYRSRPYGHGWTLHTYEYSD